MFDRRVLDIDLEREANEIVARLRHLVGHVLKRRGVVVAVSGGIDSSVSCALAVRAFGAAKVFALQLPERDSSAATGARGRQLIAHLEVGNAVEDIAPTLEAIGCYRRRDAAFASVFPGYGPGWKSKIVLPSDLLDSDRMNFYRLIVQDPRGETHEARLPLPAYLEIVAATNFKQRIRKTFEYYYADKLNYAVAGTPNRLEYDQGFFVKNGDGAADVKPIAHLYKTQVYAMARHLGLPADVCNATPTTDTYSLQQGQDEFYFVLPYAEMDLLLWAHNRRVPAAQAAAALGLQPVQVERVFRDIERKRATTLPLHLTSLLMKDVPEIDKRVPFPD